MQSGTFNSLELTNQNVNRFGEEISSITTASQWFLAKFPEQAKVYGAPFLENKTSTVDGFSTSSPLAPNISFMASILGHDEEIANSVVFYGGDSQFYYYCPETCKYHSVSDDKLGDLMRGYFQRCALGVQKDVNVYHLATTFCGDEVIDGIVERAKSVLRCSDDYFSVNSVCSRVNGIENHAKLLRAFCERCIVSSPGSVILVGQAFDRFAVLVRERELVPIKRSVFKDLVSLIIRERFGSGLRGDLVVDGRYQRGWRDLALNAGLG